MMVIYFIFILIKNLVILIKITANMILKKINKIYSYL